jgi:hypothetical protein
MRVIYDYLILHEGHRDMDRDCPMSCALLGA